MIQRVSVLTSHKNKDFGFEFVEWLRFKSLSIKTKTKMGSDLVGMCGQVQESKQLNW